MIPGSVSISQVRSFMLAARICLLQSSERTVLSNITGLSPTLRSKKTDPLGNGSWRRHGGALVVFRPSTRHGALCCAGLGPAFAPHRPSRIKEVAPQGLLRTSTRGLSVALANR